MWYFPKLKEFTKTTYLSILSKDEMSKGKSEQSCLCWNCMAENHVKGGFLVEIPFYSLDIKTAFLSLKVKRDQNKNKIDITEKKSERKSEVVLKASVW